MRACAAFNSPTSPSLPPLHSSLLPPLPIPPNAFPTLPAKELQISYTKCKRVKEREKERRRQRHFKDSATQLALRRRSSSRSSSNNNSSSETGLKTRRRCCCRRRRRRRFCSLVAWRASEIALLQNFSIDEFFHLFFGQQQRVWRERGERVSCLGGWSHWLTRQTDRRMTDNCWLQWKRLPELSSNVN